MLKLAIIIGSTPPVGLGGDPAGETRPHSSCK